MSSFPQSYPQLRARSALRTPSPSTTWMPKARLGPARSERSASFRILIVDDNRDAADSMTLLLGSLGNQVCTSYDGNEALQAFAAFRPDAVLLDLDMPGLDGYDVARLIRAMPTGPRTLMIALTGLSSREARRLTRESGLDHHSVKPVDAIILQRLIEVKMNARRHTGHLT